MGLAFQNKLKLSYWVKVSIYEIPFLLHFQYEYNVQSVLIPPLVFSIRLTNILIQTKSQLTKSCLSEVSTNLTCTTVEVFTFHLYDKSENMTCLGKLGTRVGPGVRALLHIHSS